MEVSNNLIKINNHPSLELEQALQDENYLLSYAGILSELQQHSQNSKNILLILIVYRLLLEKSKRSSSEEANIWLKNIIENIKSDEIIYFSINSIINFHKNFKSSILQLINILESLSDESKIAQSTIQKITFELYILLNCCSSNREYEFKLKNLYKEIINNPETADDFKQHATNLLIEVSWKMESNFPFAGPRSKKTQAIDNLFKKAERDAEWLKKLYGESIKWQKEENHSFWQLSARTGAVQKLAYRTAQQLFIRCTTNQKITLKNVLDNFIKVFDNTKQDGKKDANVNGLLWDSQGMFGCPTGIKKLRDLAKHREKLGDFRFLWMARHIIEERVKPSLRENPFRYFTNKKRSNATRIFYESFLAYCDFTSEDILKNLNFLSSVYTKSNAIEIFTGKIEFQGLLQPAIFQNANKI